MPDNKKNVLLIEDDPSLARVYQEYLKHESYRITASETGADGLSEIKNQIPNVILLDLKLPDMEGLEILREVKKNGLPSAVIVITADGSLNTAVEAMKLGAADFIVKPFNKDRLIYTLKNTIDRQKLTEIAENKTQDYDDGHFCGFIGSSLPMRAVYRTIENCASSKATVFITGESGTGKEVCAEAIHQLSPRSGKPFIALNCAAIPRDLMESEIFGHVKGAFTGAVANRDGAATQADEGTFFLDEICELEFELQAKLLRFIQTGVFLPVGGKDNRAVDVRFVCATNKNPWEEVQAGRFREDLYYRLFVIPIPLPPLRDREGDIMLIANSFLKKFAAEEGKNFKHISDNSTRIMINFDWPGNVRQLQNVIRNLVVLNEGEIVEASMLPPPLSGETISTPLAGPENARSKVNTIVISGDENIEPMWQIERDHINRAVDLCNGNIQKAAALLEVSPSTIYRRLKESEDV